MEEKQTAAASPLRDKLIPFSLALAVIILDQLSKLLIVHFIPLRQPGARFFGDLVRIIHVRNLGIAFSMGRDLSGGFRSVLFMLLPVIVIALLAVHYFRSRELPRLQCWALSGIIGGGAGNLIDRVFRPEGVVDFIDVKFFGLFGLERWPTFNIADSAVVVCGILLALSLVFQRKSHE